MVSDGERVRPALQYCVFCDGIAEGSDGKKSHIGVFDLFKQPGVIPQFAIAIRWVNGCGNFRQRMTILKPDLEPLMPPHEVEFQMKDRVTPRTFNITIGNVQLNDPGVYWVQVELDDNVEGAFPVPVFAGDPQQP